MLYLYLVMDIYSRKIVGGQVYDVESSELAVEVLRDICARQRIAPNQVELHSYNGSPNRGASMLATLQELGVRNFEVAVVNPLGVRGCYSSKHPCTTLRNGFSCLAVACAVPCNHACN